MVELMNDALKNGMTISVNGREYKSKYNECIDGFVRIGAQRMNEGILVVPDNAVNPEQVRSTGISANYKADSKEERYEIEQKLDSVLENVSYKTSDISYNTKISLAELYSL